MNNSEIMQGKQKEGTLMEGGGGRGEGEGWGGEESRDPFQVGVCCYSLTCLSVPRQLSTGEECGAAGAAVSVSCPWVYSSR